LSWAARRWRSAASSPAAEGGRIDAPSLGRVAERGCSELLGLVAVADGGRLAVDCDAVGLAQRPAGHGPLGEIDSERQVEAAHDIADHQAGTFGRLVGADRVAEPELADMDVKKILRIRISKPVPRRRIASERANGAGRSQRRQQERLTRSAPPGVHSRSPPLPRPSAARPRSRRAGLARCRCFRRIRPSPARWPPRRARARPG
jgi:hypothetical protein